MVPGFLLILSLLVASCDRLARHGAPACDKQQVKSTLIEAVIEHHPNLGATLLQIAVERLQQDPKMTRPFTYMDPLSGKRTTTTGAELAAALPMYLVTFQLASSMSGMMGGLAQFGDDESQTRIEQQSAATEATIRQFTEDPEVKRVMAALESEMARLKSEVRVVAIRPTRIDAQLRLCSCRAQITFADGQPLLGDEVSYTAQYTTDGQLVVTYESDD